MKSLVMNSDVLVHEATYGPILSDLDRSYLRGDLKKWKQLQEEVLSIPKYKNKWENIKEKAVTWYHSTIEMAGNYATSVNAKSLILTHLSGKYDTTSMNSKKNIQYLFEEQCKLYFNGETILACDGLIVDL